MSYLCSAWPPADRSGARPGFRQLVLRIIGICGAIGEQMSPQFAGNVVGSELIVAFIQSSRMARPGCASLDVTVVNELTHLSSHVAITTGLFGCDGSNVCMARPLRDNSCVIGHRTTH